MSFCKAHKENTQFPLLTHNWARLSQRCPLIVRVRQIAHAMGAASFRGSMTLHCVFGTLLVETSFALRVPSGVFQTVFFRFLLTSACDRGKPLQRDEEYARKHQCLKAFRYLLPLRILTTLWIHHSEKRRLENTVCYSLVCTQTYTETTTRKAKTNKKS